MLADVIPRRLPPGWRITETEKASMATLIDGEGSVALVKYHTMRLASGHHPFGLQLTIVSSTQRLLTWVATKFGGTVQRIDNKHNHIWRWRAPLARQAEILRMCLPYFILKKRQAILWLYFYERCRTNLRKRIPDGLVKRRDRVWTALRRMHARRGRPRHAG